MTTEGYARAVRRAITTASISSESAAGLACVTATAITGRNISPLLGTAPAQPDTDAIVSFDRLAVPAQLDV
jgi:hypothetical protein